jgi:hypothetical protein
MTEISMISSALQNHQTMVQNEIGMVAIKQAAQAEKALADMLATNAKAAQKLDARKGGISIYV